MPMSANEADPQDDPAMDMIIPEIPEAFTPVVPEKPAGVSAPQTGDESYGNLWLMAALVDAVLLGGYYAVKRKREA